MSKIKIVLHSTPNELDQVTWIIDQLKRASLYVDPKSFVLDFTLNVSDEDVDWENSTLSKQYCIDKFNLLFERSPFINENKISEEPTGCNTVRRNALRADDDTTHIIGLDPDLLFPDSILFYLHNAISNINNEYYIVTPQIFQLWDESWDIISHSNYKNTPRSEKLWLSDPYRLFTHEISDVGLKKLPYFKFDGGWMTLYSKNLLKLIDIPDSLGHYGLDDTFVCECSNILLRNQYDINQYSLENLIVMEDRVYRSNSMEPFIKMKDKKNNKRDISQQYFNEELNKFNKRIT
jgi:hypothetical protein